MERFADWSLEARFPIHIGKSSPTFFCFHGKGYKGLQRKLISIMAISMVRGILQVLWKILWHLERLSANGPRKANHQSSPSN